MNTESNQNIQSTSSPHFWWLISILGIAILALIALVISGQVIGSEIIMAYISSFALLLSIDLSVFAILYTYTSNDHIQGQFEKINTAATNINDASKKWTEIATQISERLERVESRQEELSKKFDNNNPNPPGAPNTNSGKN